MNPFPFRFPPLSGRTFDTSSFLPPPDGNAGNDSQVSTNNTPFGFLFTGQNNDNNNNNNNHTSSPPPPRRGRFAQPLTPGLLPSRSTRQYNNNRYNEDDDDFLYFSLENQQQFQHFGDFNNNSHTTFNSIYSLDNVNTNSDSFDTISVGGYQQQYQNQQQSNFASIFNSYNGDDDNEEIFNGYASTQDTTIRTDIQPNNNFVAVTTTTTTTTLPSSSNPSTNPPKVRRGRKSKAELEARARQRDINKNKRLAPFYKEQVLVEQLLNDWAALIGLKYPKTRDALLFMSCMLRKHPANTAFYQYELDNYKDYFLLRQNLHKLAPHGITLDETIYTYYNPHELTLTPEICQDVADLSRVVEHNWWRASTRGDKLKMSDYNKIFNFSLLPKFKAHRKIHHAQINHPIALADFQPADVKLNSANDSSIHNNNNNEEETFQIAKKRTRRHGRGQNVLQGECNSDHDDHSVDSITPPISPSLSSLSSSSSSSKGSKNNKNKRQKVNHYKEEDEQDEVVSDDHTLLQPLLNNTDNREFTTLLLAYIVHNNNLPNQQTSITTDTKTVDITSISQQIATKLTDFANTQHPVILQLTSQQQHQIVEQTKTEYYNQLAKSKR